MNLELGRSVGSTDVSPSIDPGEQVWDATCSSSLGLVPVGLAKRGPPPTLSFSPSHVDLTIPRQTNAAAEVWPQSPNIRRSGALHC